MQKKILLSMFVFFLAIGIGMAQKADLKSKVLETCISMPEFQESYAVADNNVTKKVYILQHGVSFTEEDINEINDYEIILMSKSELASNNITNYFLFWRIDTKDEGAFVEFTYEGNSVSKKVSLNVEKNDQTMAISNKKLEEVQNEK